MDALNTILPDDDHEVTIRPFDGRWEAIRTTYSYLSVDDKVRAVGSTPIEAMTKLAARIERPYEHDD